MAPQPCTGAEAARREQQLLGRLLGLYEEQRGVYARVLELSVRQGEAVRRGAELGEVRRLLEEKKRCLELVARLEASERDAKRAWEQGRGTWSAAGKARLHGALTEVTDVIEEILAREEQNDLELMARTQVV